MNENFIPKVKRFFAEPKIYALLLQTAGGGVLHLGIHYSLDEAVNAAIPMLNKTTDFQAGDHMTIEMWSSLSGKDAVSTIMNVDQMREDLIIQMMTNPTKTKGVTLPDIPTTVDTQIKACLNAKNDLMKTLISIGNLTELRKSLKFLNKAEQALVKNKITQRKNEKK